MAQNIGTLVSSPIRPNDSNDPFASAYSNEIMGGFHSYKNLNDVYTIIPLRRQWGMLASVYEDVDSSKNGIYQLKYDYQNTTITDNGNWVKTTIDGKNAVTEWADSVISILLEEPTAPILGNRYLLGTTSSVSPDGPKWDNNTATTIVEYNSNSSWDITVPINGMTVRIDNDNNAIYKYEGIFPNGEWKLEKVTNVFYINPLSTIGASYSTTTSPSFNAYTNDLIFLAKFNTANTGSASLNINGIGHKVIKIATTTGLRNLLVGDIDTTSIYSLSYNGTEFQLTKPFASDAYNIQYYISPGEVVTVEEHEQYWVYGDLEIDGSLVNYGKVIVANGTIINSGNLQIQDDGEVILVDLFNTPIFNTTDTIQLSSEMTINGPSVSAIIKNNSITTNLLNVTSGSPIADYLLSTDGAGTFKWVASGGGGGGISGTGTQNYIAKFTGSTSLGTSSIYDTGTLVGIGRIPDTGNGVLQINGGTSAIAIQTSGIGNAGTIEAKDTAIGGATIQISPQISNGVPGITVVGNFPLVFRTNSQERMRITSTGSVQLSTVPTTSAGTYSILTRNDITGEVEKIVPTYKVYTALLTQSGTASPVATVVLENTLGQVPTFTYSNDGYYLISTTGNTLQMDKNYYSITNNYYGESVFQLQSDTVDLIYLQTSINNVFTNGMLNKTPIEIRIYN